MTTNDPALQALINKGKDDALTTMQSQKDKLVDVIDLMAQVIVAMGGANGIDPNKSRVVIIPRDLSGNAETLSLNDVLRRAAAAVSEANGNGASDGN